MAQPLFNPMDLSNLNFVVTGASSGIGRATAIILSRLGAGVICCGRDSDRLSETVALLTAGNHRCESFDLSRVDDIDSWLKSIIRESGPIHGLVHAAGIQSSRTVTQATVQQLRSLLVANVESSLALVRAITLSGVFSEMGGAIVLLSSVLATAGSRGRSAYAATKGALEGLIPSLALELAPRKIRVNGIAPSFVQTPMLDEVSRFWTDAQRADVERMHPLGFGSPDDIALAAAYLLSQCGRWITGTVLVVDGGYLAQ